MSHQPSADLGDDSPALLRLSDHRPPRRERVMVRELIEEVRTACGPQLQSQAIHVEIDVPLGESVLADRGMLRDCLRHLVQNALEAMPRGGSLVVTSCNGPSALELEIADSGPGLSREIRLRAFDPEFTTKHGSAGMGLTHVRRMINAHGGQVLVRNCPEGGAAITIRIPRLAWEAAA